MVIDALAWQRQGPSWNALPVELKAASSLISFKRKLKTYLFLQAYMGLMND